MDHVRHDQPPGTTPSAPALRWRGLLQSANLRVASAALVHAPTTDDCASMIERTRQQLEHFEHSIDLYGELYGGDLRADIVAATRALPNPESWLEANVAQLVLSLAAQIEAQRWLDPSRPSRTLLKQLADKAEHVGAARAVLRDLRPSEPHFCAQVERFAARWLAVALSVMESDTRDEYLATVQAAIAA